MPLNKRSKSEFVPPIEVAGEVSPWLRFCFYGDSKVGKTMLAASAVDVPDMSPVLVISAGSSANTLRGEPRFKNVHIWRIDEFAGFNDIYDWLAPVDEGGAGHYADYKTIVLDELDNMHLMRLREIMVEVIRDDPNRDPDVPSKREWGKARSAVLNVIDAFAKLPTHLIITTWAEHSTVELTGQDRIMPSLPGKLAGEMSGRVDILAYMEVNTPRKRPGQQLTEEEQQGVRIVYFAPTKRFVTGVWGVSRAEKLGAEMINPTMQQIYERLNS